MQKTSLSLLSIALFAPLFVACEDVDSSDVLTSGMWANYTARAEDGTTRAEATIKVGGELSNTFVRLEGDDRIEVTGGDETQDLAAQNVGNVWVYNADFDAAAEDAAYEFRFLRSVDEGAPSSTVTLPAPVQIDEPSAGATVSVAAGVTVRWSPSGEADDLRLDITGPCIRVFLENLDDDGEHTVEPDELEQREADEGENCEGELVLTRSRSGTLDSGFGEGGKITGEQVDRVSVTLTP